MSHAGNAAHNFHGWAFSQKVANENQPDTQADNLKFMTEDHFRDLYEIQVKSDESNSVSFEQFTEILRMHQGFTMTSEGKVIGCILFSEYRPGESISILFTMSSDEPHEWSLSPYGYRLLFGYCFDALQVRRVTGCAIPGISDRHERLLLQLGFCYEGTMRENMKHTDGKFYDTKIYGLIKSEQKYLCLQGETL